MPELPEVETIRRGLSELIVGKQVADVDYDWPKGFPNTDADVGNFLLGAKITDVRRRAKVLMIDLSSEYSLVTHLKMTGQLVYIEEVSASSRQASFRGRDEGSEFISEPSGGASPSLRFGGGHPSASLVSELPDKTTRVTLTFADHSKLFFNDQRKFGWMRLMPTIEIENIDFMRRVGPEPLDNSLTNKEFVQRLKRRARTSIKAALLDQSVIAGLGNIYVDEVLWGTQIHPSARVEDIPTAKLNKLLPEISYILELSLSKGGSTDKNYVDAKGQRGSYLKFARVFRREGQACPRCGTTIEKIRVAGRGTHICPKCQKVTKR